MCRTRSVRFPSAILTLLTAASLTAPAHAQCTPLPGGIISYCTPISRTLSAVSSPGTPLTNSNATTGVWNQSVLAYRIDTDAPPNPNAPGSLLGGGGYAEQNTTLNPNAAFGSLRGMAWDGNQGFGGNGSSAVSFSFTLPTPVTAIISGNWSVNGAPFGTGDGSMATSRFTLSGPTNYTSGFSDTGPSSPLTGTLNFRNTLPAGTYTLNVTASENFLRVGTNLGSRTAAVNFTFTICRADFNLNGTVTVQDLFDFLGAYFAQDTRADFNPSGAISVQDIFDYLAAYFLGCP